MEHYDFICDEGLTSLRLLQRTPAEVDQPLQRMRVHVRCTDCVAGVDVDADDWSGFARLFTHHYAECGSAAWIAPGGEWMLHVERDDENTFSFTSKIDSLLDCHRWTLRTQFKMSAGRFQTTSVEVLAFLGTCHR
ncbi:hypothetical protein [Stieleria mannarensis]|uniref:hypothetical protein n=1 Tax=Stieleria mannarensis TaxID=2755585 RepID=UPI0016013D52|nr:hypothetical protein [Rhodopirellula sp. JC639]